MIRRWLRLALALASAASVIVSVWVFSRNPLAAPFIDRSASEMRARVEAAMTREVDAAWVETALRTALSDEDRDRARVVLDIADARGVAVDAVTRGDAEALIASGTGVVACARCALDGSDCADIPQVLTCNLPVELTPVGDLNALRREGSVWLAGGAVDQVDVGLAIVGLGATAAILLSGGSSASVKAGASALRVARRAKLMPTGLSDEVGDLARASVRWDGLGDVVRGRAGVESVIVAAPAVRLQRVATDVSALRANVGAGDALALIRYADGTDDVARLARVSAGLGAETRPAIETLGLARVVRLGSRLTDMALAALALGAALLSQVVGLALWLMRRALRPAAGHVPSPSP